MIQRLNKKNLIDIYDFCLRCQDKDEDWYITENKNRIMINNLKLIKKILKYQQVFGIYDNGLKAVFIIYREKNFRTYVKVLTDRFSYLYDAFRYIDWNHFKSELYLKIKKTNKINRVITYFDKSKHKTIYRYGWSFLGDRGEEVLYVRKPIIRKKEIFNDSIRTN